MSAQVSPARRREVIDALRRGTVPPAGLDLFAVGLSRFERAIDEEVRAVAAGGAVFKAIRGEYGSGKTFSRAGWPSGASGRAWRSPRSRSPRPRPRCTGWRPCAGG